ncbi:unnamed protein product [Brassica oleracea]|uniref:(rape) hypothetical protein n=1 Tax=Brassica napus TaxID=3708 RepID=A0A816KP41_BRANA|nr:unnamed protein product [Brassica napus]
MLLKKCIVSVVSLILQPAASIVAFAGFQLLGNRLSLSIFDRLISHSFLLVIDMVFVVRVSSRECLIIDCVTEFRYFVFFKAKGKLEKSIVADNDSGESVASEVRTSSGMFLSKRQDDIVATVEAKLAAWTFLPEENGQSMQILHYENGQKYEPHFDFFHDQVNQQLGGHRIATVLMYLSNVKKGGETVFPMWKIYKAQRNVVLCAAGILLYWCIHHICKYNKDLEHLEELEKRYKAE